MDGFVRIRFVTEDDLVSRMIRVQTWCEFSHVEFVLDDGTTLGAHFSGGVRIRPANYSQFTKIAVFDVPVTAEQKATILGFANAQLGKGYDTEAIAGLVSHHDWRNPDKWFCSELVTAAFEQAFPLLHVPNSVNRITPRDVLLSVLLLPAA